MTRKLLARAMRAMACAATMCAVVMSAAGAEAQTATAVPHLDRNRYMGVWFEIARLPDKREKTCVSDATVLYALAEKPLKFQMVTSCQIKGNNPDAWNATVAMDKAIDGAMKQTYVWPFSTKYWVLALGDNYEWALVGSPNHKTMWVLSRTRVMTPEVLATVKAKAVAEGFDLGKLITVIHRK